MTVRGPFAAWMHAPELGELAQRLGAHCRYRTRVAGAAVGIRHPVHGARTGARKTSVRPRADGGRRRVKPKTIADLQAGREPKSAPKDERAIYAFGQELYKTRRVSDRTYKRVQVALGDAATVELVGILGYYVLISMTLNVFRMLPPEQARSSPSPSRNNRSNPGARGTPGLGFRLRQSQRCFVLDDHIAIRQRDALAHRAALGAVAPPIMMMAMHDHSRATIAVAVVDHDFGGNRQGSQERCAHYGA